MSKEYIQALNIIKFNPNDVDGLQYLEAFKVVESALQRLESIDNAKPSEALELVGYLKDYLLNMLPYYDWLNDIEKYILKSQEQEKVLEIIFKKTVGIFQLSCCKNVYEYNDLKFNDNEKLTQEEFDLLKKWEEKYEC